MYSILITTCTVTGTSATGRQGTLLKSVHIDRVMGCCEASREERGRGGGRSYRARSTPLVVLPLVLVAALWTKIVRAGEREGGRASEPARDTREKYATGGKGGILF